MINTELKNRICFPFLTTYAQWLSNQSSLITIKVQPFSSHPASLLLPNIWQNSAASGPLHLVFLCPHYSPSSRYMHRFLTSSGFCLNVKLETSNHSKQNAVPPAYSIPLSHSSVFGAPCETSDAFPALLSVSSVRSAPPLPHPRAQKRLDSEQVTTHYTRNPRCHGKRRYMSFPHISA